MSDQDQPTTCSITATGSPSSSSRWPSCTGGWASEEPAGGFVFASDARASDNVIEHPRMAEALQSGNKIEAIKLYRELTGAGLKEAKDAVERIAP